MLPRILGTLFLTGGLFSGVIGTNPVQPVTPTPIRRSAPELDPSSLGAGIVILAGSLLAFSERRLKKK